MPIFFLTCLAIFFIFTVAQKPKQESKQILRFALPSDISTLHFASSSKGCSINSSHVMSLLFDGLMRRDENDIPKLAIAKKIDISEDRKTYVFHLRDCYWSDGVKVTAYDFEYAWRNVIDPDTETTTQTPFFYYPIKNAKKCFVGEISCDCLGITIPDDQTLIVELEYPAPYFLDLIASPQFLPAPIHYAKKNHNWATTAEIVCNGPYTLKKWHHNSELLLSKNPDYWDQEHVYLDEIEVCIIPNSSTVLSMFEKGQLDWIGSPFIRMSYDISRDLLDQQYEDALVYWIAFNTDKPVLSNQKFRKALAYAINRKSITDNIFSQSATPLMAVLPHSMSLKDEPYFEDANIALAQQYLREALQELSLPIESLPEIQLGYVADLEIHHRTTQAIQDQWRTVLGIKNIVLQPIEYNVYFDNVTYGNYDMGFMGWASHIHDPLFILNSFKNKAELMNKVNWENERFKYLLDASEYAASKTERHHLLSLAEAILIDEMPIIPICSLKKQFAKNPKLRGEHISNLQAVDFKTAYFED